jgi:hypothetical protein
MKKQWIKKDEFNYAFLIDGAQIGTMEIHFSTAASKAICTISDKQFEINRTGFWKSNLEITDSNNAIVLKAYPEKWYANTSIIEWETNRCKLIVRNNPLAEFVVTTNDDHDMLAYSLATENREVKIRISTTGNPDTILDFLLWYKFLPIANENFGDAYSFLVAQTL